LSKLRFYARNDADGPRLVTVPGSRPMRGQAAQYVGRKFIPGDAEKGVPAQFPATEAPHEALADSDEGRRLVKVTREDAALWPADKETAAACGVDFVAVEVKDGVAVPKSPAASASKPSRKPGDDGA
jgi:citrate lyase beta subunit